MRVVIDSSVAVKWVVDEADAALARPLLDLKPEAPDFIIPECAHVLWKKVRKGELDEQQAANSMRLLAALNLPLWGAIDLSDRALELSLRLDHAAYDCFYLALSERLGAPFVTADGKLARKVAASGIRIDIVLLGDTAAFLGTSP